MTLGAPACLVPARWRRVVVRSDINCGTRAVVALLGSQAGASADARSREATSGVPGGAVAPLGEPGGWSRSGGAPHWRGATSSA
jgi:hypothetical protein